jgi:sugar phosphate permease
MTQAAHELETDLSGPSAVRLPFYYGWIILFMAALAMVGTLPGRSVGLGLITEPLLADLKLSRASFGQMNFWATLIGAAFNFFCGPALDRFGVRRVSILVLAALGLVVLAFSQVAAAGMVLLLLILMRGLGQSALSVVSLTMIGKWFVRRLSIAMGIFSVIISIAFAVLILVMQQTVAEQGWRGPWRVLGWGLVSAAVLSWLLVRRSPEAVGYAPDLETQTEAVDESGKSTQVAFTMSQALRTAAFWVFAVGSALYNLVISGVLLFNQSILQQLGLGDEVYRNAMATYMLTGMAGNFFAGWLARKWSLLRFMSIAMVLVGLYLLILPALTSAVMAIVHAALLGLSGGVVVVIFFTAWGKVFGRLHLGKIQGAAQFLTVLSSAAGPWILAEVFERTGSYNPAFYGLAPAILIVAIAGWMVRFPESPLGRNT